MINNYFIYNVLQFYLESLSSNYFIYLFIYLLFFNYSYLHTRLRSFLPPAPTPPLPPTPPSPSPPTPSIAGRNYFALISNWVEERV
jgi:hypothetical protein